jgi:FixJ family two-component response regulator
MIGDVPVILATGYADMAEVERLAGKPTILRKPFDINSLGEAVAGALEKSALHGMLETASASAH